MLTITEKVPGGKLVRIKLDVEFGVIRKAGITGDFFLHPEDVIDKIEEALTGITINQDPDIITTIISSVLENNNAQLIGATPEDLTRMIKTVLK